MNLQQKRMLKIEPDINSYGAACNLCSSEAAAVRPDRPRGSIGGAGSAPTSVAGLLGDLELVHPLQHHVHKAKPIHLTSLEMRLELYPRKALCRRTGDTASSLHGYISSVLAGSAHAIPCKGTLSEQL